MVQLALATVPSTEHRDVEVAVALDEGTTKELTVIAMVLLFAVGGVIKQPPAAVSSQETTSPLASVVLENVGLLVPTFEPFTFHWYDGLVPPFVGFAVKVTFAPAHIVVALAAIVTLGVNNGLTVMVIVLLFAVGGITKQPPEAVSSHETTSLFKSVLLENVGLLVPTLNPFTFHW